MRMNMLGYKPDKPDARDWIYKAPPLTLPNSIDLRPFAREIEDQGHLGSCVGNASCSALEMQAKIHGTDINLSRLFMYYNIRREFQNPVTDDGAYPRDAFKMGRLYGICTENIWPYVESEVNNQPDTSAYQAAPNNKSIRYYRIDPYVSQTIIDVKTAISNNNPVLLGMPLGEKFNNMTHDINTQNYPKVTDNYGDNKIIGGHAMNICGYVNDVNKPGGGYFIVENSWGSNWGDNGFWAMSYEVAQADASDLWVCPEFRIGLISNISIPEPIKIITKLYKSV